MSNVRHILGVSGGKDSAALAIYMRQKYPKLDINYYMSDTESELQETEDLVKRMEGYLGKPIKKLRAAEGNSHNTPFEHFLKIYRSYLPSSQARWCTKKMKLEPFENEIGDKPTISYVGIRDDEQREGYISTKSNIQSIFPFRRNIWSLDVINKVLHNSNIGTLAKLYYQQINKKEYNNVIKIIETPLTKTFYYSKKLNALMDYGVPLFNKVVFEFLKTTDYPVGQLEEFPLIENEDELKLNDIFRLLEDSGVGIPGYYKEIEYEVNGKKGTYSRSRSGCYFCFFQQKIEWVWLYEQHPDLFKKAMQYEKDGYTWMDNESLAELCKPERIKQIKEDNIKRTQQKLKKNKSPYLIDTLFEEGEENLCVNCFV